ncbi:hypothetical protein [Saccharopolyspora rosea]|uniref:Uncharacterized protein n=1 Tax=Saccharopolyspora rosea TaxID=524884 RepID=A0ABW3FRW7_9PSEU|nr:hypothetical protein [Saccharopolyspora rosea]
MPERLFFAWTFSCADEHEHAVTDEAFLHAYRDGSGLSESLCGHRVVPGPLGFPPGPRCRECARCVQSRTAPPGSRLRGAERSRPRRRASAVFGRLFPRSGRSRPCAAVRCERGSRRG